MIDLIARRYPNRDFMQGWDFGEAVDFIIYAIERTAEEQIEMETGGYITIKAARRIISYRGYFSHTDSVGISAKLHIVEVSRAASNVISAAARAELAAAA